MEDILSFLQTYYIFIIIGVLLAIANFLPRKEKEKTEKTEKTVDFAWCKDHYERKDSLLTDNEIAYYQELKVVVGDHFEIFSKVRLEDVIKAKSWTDNTARNKIKSRHIDFLLCDPNTFKPKIAIELDDKSHNRSDRMERDKFYNELFEACQLPLLHVPAQGRYKKEDIRDDLVAIMKPAGKA